MMMMTMTMQMIGIMHVDDADDDADNGDYVEKNSYSNWSSFFDSVYCFYIFHFFT